MSENKDRFIRIIKENVQREGIDKLLEWLDKTDFYTAPASSRLNTRKEKPVTAVKAAARF